MLIQREFSKYNLQTLGINGMTCATQQHTAPESSCSLLPALFQCSCCIPCTSYQMHVIGVSQLTLLNLQKKLDGKVSFSAVRSDLRKEYNHVRIICISREVGAR